MDTVVPVWNKNFSGDGTEFTEVSRFVGKAKSHLYRQFLGVLGTLEKNHLGIIVPQSLTVPRQMVLLREQNAESRKELLQHCCNPAWMKNGGLIPWNATVIFERFQTSYRTRKHFLWTEFGDLFSGLIIRFGSMIEYHPVSADDQSGLHQLGREVLPRIFRTHLLHAQRVYLERRHHDRGHRGAGKLGRATNPCSKSQCEGGPRVPKMVKFFIPDRRWDSHVVLKGSGCADNHPNSGGEEHNDVQGEPGGSQLAHTPTDEVKPDFFFWRSLGIFFIVIALNQQLKPGFSEWKVSHNATRVHCCQANKNLGCVGGEPHWRWLERCWWPGTIGATNQFHAVPNIECNTSRRTHVVLGETADRHSSNNARLIHGQRFGQECQKSSSTKRKNSSGPLNHRSSTMRECWEAFLSSIRMIWSSRTPWKKRAQKLESSMESATPVKVPKSWAGWNLWRNFQPKTRRSKHACIVEPLESKRKHIGRTQPKDHEDRNGGKGFNSLSHYNLVHKFIPMLQAMKNPGCESRCWQGVGKARKFACMAMEENQQKKDVIQETQKEVNNCSFCEDGHMPPQKL